MPVHKEICVTKDSVNALIGILNQTIDILHSKGSKQILTDEEYDMLLSAQEEKKTYVKARNMMEKEGHMTLCLRTSAINRKGTIKVFEGEE